jgi:hypothetical protein
MRSSLYLSSEAKPYGIFHPLLRYSGGKLTMAQAAIASYLI